MGRDLPVSPLKVTTCMSMSSSQAPFAHYRGSKQQLQVCIIIVKAHTLQNKVLHNTVEFSVLVTKSLLARGCG